MCTEHHYRYTCGHTVRYYLHRCPASLLRKGQVVWRNVPRFLDDVDELCADCSETWRGGGGETEGAMRHRRWLRERRRLEKEKREEVGSVGIVD